MKKDNQKISACPICEESCQQKYIERFLEYIIYRCMNCSVEYALPMRRDKDEQRDKKIYFRRESLVGNYIGWDHRAFIKENIKKGGRILDIGCGTGDFVNLANECGYDAIGVDLDEEAIAAGRRYWKTNRIYAMSAEDYFAKNRKKFHIICLFNVLEHLENPHKMLEEIKKYLHPYGYICISVPNNDSTLNKIWRVITKADYPPHHLTRWSAKAIEIFLQHHNFEILTRKTCEPRLTDIIPDFLKIYAPRSIKATTVMKISGITCRVLSPLDYITKKIASEGRSQLVIARRKK